MKRTRLNLGLFAVVVGAGVAVWVSEQQSDAPKPTLTPLSVDAVQDIAIEYPDQPVVKLHKDGDAWRIVAPVDAPTDRFEVSSLTGLATLEVQRSVPLADVDLAELKLDPPGFRITLNDQVLAFGDTAPLNHQRYVLTSTEVALVADPPSAALDADYSDLVARELLPQNVALQRIEVPHLVVAREDDHWVAEGQPDVSSDQLVSFVNAWRSARAMWNALIPAGTQHEGTPIHVVTADGAFDLYVVETEPQLVLDRPDYGVRYTLSKADVMSLLSLPEPPEAPSSAADVDALIQGAVSAPDSE